MPFHIYVKKTLSSIWFTIKFQSDTCTINIPELSSEFGAAGLSGRFTTIEGLLSALREQILENGAIFEDSAHADAKTKIDKSVSSSINVPFFNRLIFNCSFYLHVDLAKRCKK